MRILDICAYSWEIGGPPKIIYDHTKVALSLGHQVDILSPISPGEKPYPVPEGARLILCKRTPVISRFFREFSIELYQYLQQHIHEYDVVHCHGLWHFGSIAPFMVDKKVVKAITTHGLLDKWVYARSYWKKRIMDTLAQKAYVRRADVVQINNTDEKENLAEYLGFQHPNVVIIPNGINVADFANAPAKGTFRKQFNIPEGKKLVLFMSRLNLKKGLDILLPAFKAYAQENNDAFLALAGSDDGYEQETRAFIEQHKLSDSMQLVGMLTGETKRAALADADIFALPSYSEGFSMACLEALASGTPSLLSDRVGFGESLRAYDAAELVELTVDGVHKGLTHMLQSPERREQVRQNAYRLIQEKYDINLVARQLLAAYETALQRRK